MNKSASGGAESPRPALSLRALEEDDIPLLQAWQNDEELAALRLGYLFPVGREDVRRWLAPAGGRWPDRICYGIEIDARLIGYTAIEDIDWISATAWFAIMIGDPNWRGRGLGAAVVEEVCRRAFCVFALRKLCLRVASYNDRALRLYRRSGFREEGCLKGQIRSGGRFHDLLILARYAPELTPAGDGAG